MNFQEHFKLYHPHKITYVYPKNNMFLIRGRQWVENIRIKTKSMEYGQL